MFSTYYNFLKYFIVHTCKIFYMKFKREIEKIHKKQKKIMIQQSSHVKVYKHYRWYMITGYFYFFFQKKLKTYLERYNNNVMIY